MKLSTYLTLEEATRSWTAKRNGLSNEVTNPDHLENLKWLAKTVYDPLKFEFPQMFIQIIYRTLAVNEAVGGALRSQHLVGEAADLDSPDNKLNAAIFRHIVKHLPFDQVIWEFGNDTNPDWVHVSCKRGDIGNRKKITRAIREGGKTKYIPFNLPL